MSGVVRITTRDSRHKGFVDFQHDVGDEYAVFRTENGGTRVLGLFSRQIVAVAVGWQVYAITGSSDFLIHVMAADLDGLSEFTTRTLLRMPGIRDTQSSIVLSVLKDETAVPLNA